MKPQVDTGPNLLLDWEARDTSNRPLSTQILRAGVGSVVAHVVILFLLITIAGLDTSQPEQPVDVAKVHKIVTPLIAPPTPLTQKEPNRTKVPKEVKLENLLPEKQIAQQVPAPPQPPEKLFKAPPQRPAAPAPQPAPAQLPQDVQRIEATLKPPQFLPPTPVLQPPVKLFKAPPQRLAPAAPKTAPVQLPVEAPRIEASLKPPQGVPALPVVQLPPPRIQPAEKPKLALETPGQSGTGLQKGGLVKIPVPKASVDEAVHSIARGGGGSGGGLVVGDADQTPSLGEQLHRPASHGNTASSLSLLSDPMGVDFKPYLIRILATVRRNWFAVIPESVRLGRRGKVTLQFAIDRSGGVPKLVIAMPSGAEALDRAAVAGISASVPFPPLPKEFPGQQIRLQFAFQYNMQ